MKHDMFKEETQQDVKTSHLHLLIPIGVTSTEGTAGYPSLVQFLLESCNLLQALRLTDHLLHTLSLGIGQFDADSLVGLASRGGGARGIERPGLDAHDL